jgi:hypothetical protein
MSPTRNIWQNDSGFIWMLIISILTLISSQLTDGVIGESRFIVRVGFFLFTVIAVNSSTLSGISKLFGYIIPFLLLFLAIAMIRSETPFLLILYSVVASGYLIFIILLIVNQIFSGEKITIYKIGGGVACYILLGQLWASLYLTIYIIDPTSFIHNGVAVKNDEALKQLSYFSFVTLTTIGYGDVIAVNAMARILVILEGLLGQLFPAIFIAKLVSQQIEDSKK